MASSSPNRNLYDVHNHVAFGGGRDDGGKETVNKMRKPKNLDNYNECLDISDDPPGVCVFCVECDEWHSVDMIAMGRARIGKGDLKDFEPEDSSIKFECSRCGADVNYIVLCDWRRAIKAMLEWI